MHCRCARQRKGHGINEIPMLKEQQHNQMDELLYRVTWAHFGDKDLTFKSPRKNQLLLKIRKNTFSAKALATSPPPEKWKMRDGDLSTTLTKVVSTSDCRCSVTPLTGTRCRHLGNSLLCALVVLSHVFLSHCVQNSRYSHWAQAWTSCQWAEPSIKVGRKQHYRVSWGSWSCKLNSLLPVYPTLNIHLH